MDIRRIAAFTHHGTGGNPAGVVICDRFPAGDMMLQTAKDVGYSETAFLRPKDDGWRIRYFSPMMEVPFCGHATIASGSVLGERFGEGVYRLFLNNDNIGVTVRASTEYGFSATLLSPGTASSIAPRKFILKLMAHFNFTEADVDARFPVRFASAGAKHLIIFLEKRKMLAAMKYSFNEVRDLMVNEGLATISLVWRESDGRFHSRNPFASGGIYEDPATGAAAAALAGYLRDIKWHGKRKFEIIQGEDMGCPSRIEVAYTDEPGAGVSISGSTRVLPAYSDHVGFSSIGKP